MRQGSGLNRSSSVWGGEAMASGSNWLSGVNVVLVMAYGSLVRRFPHPIPAVASDPVETLLLSSPPCPHSPPTHLHFSGL